MQAVGLEPTTLAGHGPKPCAYANSATPAQEKIGNICFNYNEKKGISKMTSYPHVIPCTDIRKVL